MPEEIVIVIDETGAAEIAVKGHAGSGCKKLTEDLEKALGVTTKDVKTAEFHQRAAQQQQQRIGR